MNKLNLVVQSLINAGLIDTIADIQPAKASEHVFEAEHNEQREEHLAELGAVVAKATKEVKAIADKLSKAKSDETKAKFVVELADANNALDAAKAAYDAAVESTDLLMDARTMWSFISMLRIAHGFALRRQALGDIPLKDIIEAQSHMPLESAYESSDGNPELTEADAARLQAKSAETTYLELCMGETILSHYARIPENTMLRKREKREIKRDENGKMLRGENGNVIVEIATTGGVPTWKDHVLRLDAERDGQAKNWLEMVDIVVDSHIHDTFDHLPIDVAKVEFNRWLDEVPNRVRQDDQRTHREALIQNVANTCWRQLKTALLNPEFDPAFAMRDYAWLQYSPLAAAEIAQIKKHPAYLSHKLEEQRIKMEAEHAQRMLQLAEMEYKVKQAQFDAEMKSTSERINTLLSNLESQIAK